MSLAHLPAPIGRSWGSSILANPAHSSWTKSARCTLRLQAKLLHVLQDGEFSRLGGKRDISVDVRVLAATNKRLELAVQDGTFREDLFYRLNVITIHIPPLRERREEIPIFLDYFRRKYSEFYGKQPPPFGDPAMAA